MPKSGATIVKKLLKDNPNATNLDFLHALMREMHTPDELAQFHAELDAEHAAHAERMSRRAALEGAVDSHRSEAHSGIEPGLLDLHKLGRGLALIAEALAGGAISEKQQ